MNRGRVTTVRSETINALLGDVPPRYGQPILTVDEWDWWVPITERRHRFDPDVEEMLRRLLADGDDDYCPWLD